MIREPIYAALFALLQSAAPFVTASRRLRHWSDVGAAEQPALFMIQKSEAAEERRPLPIKWRASVELYLYAQAPDEATPPSMVMNPLLDALEAALAPDPASHVQTLGGLVQHCWIAGRITTDEGVLGGQSVAIVPVEILVSG
ncbi:MAG TPA: hypothetical protein VN766_17480 [Stellaceae bacterium]|nr:hypothetical protein [Stellaceae bacterium]